MDYGDVLGELTRGLYPKATGTLVTETAVARAKSLAQDDRRPEPMKDNAGFKIGPDFFLDLVIMKKIKNRQINKVPKSAASVDAPAGASASMVAAKLDRIRIIVMIRRDQRSEVCNEIWVVIDINIPLVPAALCLCYGCHYGHDAKVSNSGKPASFQTLYNPDPQSLYPLVTVPFVTLIKGYGSDQPVSEPQSLRKKQLTRVLPSICRNAGKRLYRHLTFTRPTADPAGL